MRNMSQTNQTIEERLTELEQSHCEFMEYVNGGFVSIKVMLAKIKEDHYDKQPEETEDDLDQLVGEIQDTINWIDVLINPEEE